MTDGNTNETVETERPEAATDAETEAETSGTDAATDGAATDGQDPAETLGNEQLAAAIEANPEAVAGLVERLDAVNELLDVVALGQDAMTDEMVVSIARTGSNLGELADTAADPDTRDGVTRLLKGIGNAERAEPEPSSTLALLKSLRDPEVKRGLTYLVALARGIGAADPDADTE